MTTKKKIFIIALTAILLLIPNLAFAAMTDEINGMISKLFAGLNVILLFLQAFLWPILLLTGSLLSNDLIFSGGMQTMLLNIWSYVRDFVNIMFVLGLLAVALMNIFAAGGDKFAPKKIVPKILIGLIVVNFSFFGCKIVLDAVNVATTAIFAMPLAQDSFKAVPVSKYQDAVCNKMQKYADTANKNSSTSTAKGAKTPATQNPEFMQLCVPDETSPNSKKLSPNALQFFSNFNSRNVALVLAVELMDITKLDNLVDKGVGTIDTLQKLTINTLFSIIFTFMYGSAFIALFVILLVRVVVLWLSIAVSPLSALSFAFDFKMGDDDPMKLFLAHAMAPLYIAPVLTIGMIMITQLKQMSPNTIASTNPVDLGTLVSGMSSLQELLAGFATTVFIWTAIGFAAKNGGKGGALAKSLVLDPVEKLAKETAKMPLYVPILPVTNKDGKTTNVGIAGLANTLSGPESYNKARQTEIDNLFGNKASDYSNALDKAKNDQAAIKREVTRIIGETGGAVSEDIQKKMASSLKNLNKFETPSTYDRDKFLKELSEGHVSSSVLNEFISKNGWQNAASGSQALSEAMRAQEKANVPKISNPVLKQESNKLDELIKKLDAAIKNNDNSKVLSLTSEINEQTQKVNNISAGSESASNFTISAADIDASGNVADPKKKDLKDLVKNLKGRNISDEQIKQLLTEIIKNNHLTGINADQLFKQANS